MVMPARSSGGCASFGVAIAVLLGGCGLIGTCGAISRACGGEHRGSSYVTSPTAAVVFEASTPERTITNDATRIIALCGKPTSDKTSANNRKGWDNSGGTRNVIYKKANVELMFFVDAPDAGDKGIVGVFPADQDAMADQLNETEVNKRLPCAKGTIHAIAF